MGTLWLPVIHAISIEPPVSLVSPTNYHDMFDMDAGILAFVLVVWRGRMTESYLGRDLGIHLQTDFLNTGRS